MVEEQLLREFIERLKAAQGANLISVVLYGSAADSAWHGEYSDVNLLCVLADASFSQLSSMGRALEWWSKKRHAAPLVLRRDELVHAAASFSVEFCDVKQRHRLLYGEDLLSQLQVPMRNHRAQVEYELQEKLFLLRQQLLLAGHNRRRSWEVMLHSVSSFVTLFRHVLLELGQAAGFHSREAVEELSRRLDFDPSGFLELLEVRASRKDRKHLDVMRIAQTYLAAIEKVRAAIEQAGSVGVQWKAGK